VNSLQKKVDDFLSQKSIAVAGVSSTSSTGAANSIYKKLKDSGYAVYPTNPRTDTIEGDRCYPDLKSIPDELDGVVICTKPEVAVDIVKECIEIGVKRVWMHRAFGPGSVSDEAAKLGRESNLTVISGACPMMYCQPVDFGHKCMYWFLKVFGKLPG
jgi:predicted CoA-binding protein